MLPATSETFGAIAAAPAKAQGELSRQPSAMERLSNAAMVPSYQYAFVTWLAVCRTGRRDRFMVFFRLDASLPGSGFR
jgi:hypothetical protein